MITLMKKLSSLWTILLHTYIYFLCWMTSWKLNIINKNCTIPQLAPRCFFQFIDEKRSTISNFYLSLLVAIISTVWETNLSRNNVPNSFWIRSNQVSRSISSTRSWWKWCCGNSWPLFEPVPSIAFPIGAFWTISWSIAMPASRWLLGIWRLSFRIIKKVICFRVTFWYAKSLWIRLNCWWAWWIDLNETIICIHSMPKD